MRKQISMSEAIEKIMEICEYYSVPISIYEDNNLPEGRQQTEDIISINRDMGFILNADTPGYTIQYKPWIRVMTSLDIEEFNKLLAHGQNVSKCVQELNEYFKDKLITEIE